MRCCSGRERWNPSLCVWPFLDKEQGKGSSWRITKRNIRVNGDSSWRQAREMRHHLEDGGGWWNWSDDEDDPILLMGSSAETGVTGIFFLRADSAAVDKKTKIWASLNSGFRRSLVQVGQGKNMDQREQNACRQNLVGFPPSPKPLNSGQSQLETADNFHYAHVKGRYQKISWPQGKTLFDLPSNQDTFKTFLLHKTKPLSG